ncbi:phage tail domain-containing protein [Bacillus thuringiensis]|uniref:phage tail domain-containing protein n=1 Tax=Bacillus thuringiensis TaxID=1428 RepID=UPI000BFBC3D7|nr:phage tail domain-containing protein [Bacillus thuringiensis]PGQ63383.1 hypothetical protein COA16_02295 [Bacillus thuringiensis]
MDLIIEHLDGTIYRTNQLGIRVKGFDFSSPDFDPAFSEVDGLDGKINIGAKGRERTATASIDFKPKSESDYISLRNKIFKLFYSKKEFYITDSREPNIRTLVRARVFTPENINHVIGRCEIEFIATNVYRESVSIWLKEFLNSSTFTLNNPGDEYVDLRNSRQFFIIRFRGASTNLTIENTTTLQKWQYTGSSLTSDIIEMKYVRSTKSGISIFRDTNHQIISLAPGDNNFKITGASGVYSTEFRFRSYHI